MIDKTFLAFDHASVLMLVRWSEAIDLMRFSLDFVELKVGDSLANVVCIPSLFGFREKPGLD